MCSSSVAGLLTQKIPERKQALPGSNRTAQDTQPSPGMGLAMLTPRSSFSELLRLASFASRDISVSLHSVLGSLSPSSGAAKY